MAFDNVDLNLLTVLDALLETSSVTVAAERLHTSPPAVSRSLARLRRATGDPLLVRAGRDLVPTPRALAIRSEVASVLGRAHDLLTTREAPDPATFERSFAVQTIDAFIALLVVPLVSEVVRQAPRVVVRFLPDSLEGTSALRDGRVDLEIGVIEHTDPETLLEPLAEYDFVGVARRGHPLTERLPTVEGFAEATHLGVSRRGRIRGPIDDQLAQCGLTRRVVATVPSYSAGLIAVTRDDLVCAVPDLGDDLTLAALGLRTFPIPLRLPRAQVSMAWHPRHAADPAHIWMRARVRDAFVALQKTAPHGAGGM